MISLLVIALGLATEPPQSSPMAYDPALESRLLGDLGDLPVPSIAPQAMPQSQTPAPAPAPTPLSWWMLGLGGLALGGLYWFRNHTLGGTPPADAAPMKVLARTGLGGRGAAILVEVNTPQGAVQRLLLGTGEGGPRLLAEVGTAAPVAMAAPPVRRPAPSPKPSRTEFADALSQATTPQAPSRPKPTEEAQQIINQVLAGRGTTFRGTA